MSKVLIRLNGLILTAIFFSLFLPKTTLAANCTFTYDPDPPNQNMGNLSVTIDSQELKSGTYRVQGDRPDKSSFYIRDINFTSGTATLTIEKVPSGWEAGTYKLYFIEQDKTGNLQDIATCQTSFTITDIPVSPSCVASIETKPIEPDTAVILTVNGINSGTYNIFINNKLEFTNDIPTGKTQLAIGNFNAGIYTVTIKNPCRQSIGFGSCLDEPAPRLQCNSVTFTVARRGSGGGGQIGTTPGTASAKVCTEQDINDGKCSSGGGESCSDERGPAFKTAIGCIHTSPAEFVKDLLKFVIGISGGLAFLMMLLGAFQMLTSAGNPDTLNAGKDRLTSAVIGLLFVIFSILLLQIIGVDILGIPGFKR